MHKRKHRKSIRDGNWDQPGHTVRSTFIPDNLEAVAPDLGLFIQAHESDIIRGPPALAARSLECQDTVAHASHSGSGLIRWGREGSYVTDTIDPHEPNKPPLWVDRWVFTSCQHCDHMRFFNGTLKVSSDVVVGGPFGHHAYDVRLLLDHLPDFPSEVTQSRPLSPGGWSDLPSDSEDTFFFSPDELEDYHREKRRRLIDRGREERLRALATIDSQEDPDPWGGSDEEPEEPERELMCRTARHIISSPNPGQLEMRILANYGTDKRFAFLRGRWSRVWKTEKERARQGQAEEAKKIQLRTALGGLASYGDSDNDGEEAEDKPPEEPEGTTDPNGRSDEDDIKEARRARAREWSARRRADQVSHSEGA